MINDLFEDENEEEFNNDELNKEINYINNLNESEIKKIIDQNYDARTKDIGDIVVVWDTSRLTDQETGEIVTDDIVLAKIINYPSIVIEIYSKFNVIFKTLKGDFAKNLDIVIWNKNLNRKYRTSSDFIKLKN